MILIIIVHVSSINMAYELLVLYTHPSITPTFTCTDLSYSLVRPTSHVSRRGLARSGRQRNSWQGSHDGPRGTGRWRPAGPAPPRGQAAAGLIGSESCARTDWAPTITHRRVALPQIYGPSGTPNHDDLPLFRPRHLRTSERRQLSQNTSAAEWLKMTDLLKWRTDKHQRMENENKQLIGVQGPRS